MVSREVTARGSAALDEIAAEFGSDMLTPDGSLDRRKLGAYVFSDRAALDRLEGSNIDGVYCANTLPSKVSKISIAKIIAKALREW